MILAKNPPAIHFTGHGFQNTSKRFPNSLLLEQEDGEGEELNE